MGPSGAAIADASEGCMPRVRAVLDEFIADPVASVERVVGATIEVGATRLAAKDPRFPDALARAFRVRGFDAWLYDGPRADAWRLLQSLSPSPEARTVLASSLHAVPDAEVVAMLAALKDAETKMRGITSEAETRRGELAEKEAALVREFEERFGKTES